ncbi:MAG TPA: 4'-phosphopantetheinyl transferase superfamily protein, partial [Chthonomonadales bacterium]|nr:4'-phosphopantetheinyl transferase superfamily protein [Chthonomonadales bacterium]
MTASTCPIACKEWESPPADYLLPPGEIHVWQFDLDSLPDRADAAAQLMCPDEQARAARFHFSSHRLRFTAAHSALRAVLARYLETDPRAIEFGVGRHGKPFLAGKVQGKLTFNLSHSHGRALLAVSRRFTLGVDIEFIRPDFAGLDIARRYFSHVELQALEALAPELRAQAFFLCWTRKEAFIKATGMGLSFPL